MRACRRDDGFATWSLDSFVLSPWTTCLFHHCRHEYLELIHGVHGKRNSGKGLVVPVGWTRRLADVTFIRVSTQTRSHFFPVLATVLQGLVGAPACGDVMKLQIRVDDNGNIIESKFKTFGCGSAIASSSVATEWVKGKSVDEVLAIKNADIAAHLKLPPVKLHCSMLAEDAIKAAVQDWKAKQEAKKQQLEQQAA